MPNRTRPLRQSQKMTDVIDQSHRMSAQIKLQIHAIKIKNAKLAEEDPSRPIVNEFIKSHNSKKELTKKEFAAIKKKKKAVWKKDALLKAEQIKKNELWYKERDRQLLLIKKMETEKLHPSETEE